MMTKTKLIKYLAKHNHWSPFGHASLQFHIIPVFVARQLVKHQIGLTWNEVSRRYVDDKPDFYHPLIWRGNDEKTRSSDVEIDINPAGPTGPTLVDVYQQAVKSCRWTYEELLRKVYVQNKLAWFCLSQ